MIKKLADLSDIRGSMPLMSVIQTDSVFFSEDTDGVYCQENNGERSLVLSLRGPTATICKLSEDADLEELRSFLAFRQIRNLLSDYPLEGLDLEARCVLRAQTACTASEDVTSVSHESRLVDYQSIFKLLSSNGDFNVWYPLFSRKVNKRRAFGVYYMENGAPVSCAASPFTYNKIGVIAGVYTHSDYRRRGLASKCVRALLSDMKNNGIEEAYLWCENQNIKLYKNIGFSECGKIYVKREE